MAYDLLIKHGLIVDGSGMPAFLGDVGTKDGKIVEIGRLDDRSLIKADHGWLFFAEQTEGDGFVAASVRIRLELVSATLHLLQLRHAFCTYRPHLTG